MIRSRTGLFAIVFGVVSILGVARSPAQDEDAKIQAHEWSFWIVDPTLDQANHLAAYASLMPILVDTDRSRVVDKSPFSPLGMVALYGENCADAEVDYRIQSGRFLAHWPPGEKKNNRLRWIEMVASDQPNAEGRFSDADEKHWFHRARELGSLSLKKANRNERFLAYDAELAFSVPLKLAASGDNFRVGNIATHPLFDVLILAPSPDGLRWGRLDVLPQENTLAPGVAEAAAGKVVKEVVSTAVDAAAEALKNALGTTPAAPAEGAPATPAAPAEPVTGVEITMSAPLKSDDPELGKAKDSLTQSLVKAGLNQKEAELFVSIYSGPIFSTSEVIVLCRLPVEVIEQKLPLTVYPTPTKTVRVPIVLVRNIDPKIKDEVARLVVELGNDEFGKREAAEKRLLELGRLAVPALKAALASTDLETAFRAERLLLKQNESIDTPNPLTVGAAPGVAGGAVAIQAAGVVPAQVIIAAPAAK